jgi:hypothetical protein
VKQDFPRFVFPDIVKNVNRFGSPNDDVGLFTDFALDRCLQAFTRFDAATRNGPFPFDGGLPRRTNGTLNPEPLNT